MESSKSFLIVWIPDENVHGIVRQESAHWYRVEFHKNGVFHSEIFHVEDVVPLKEVIIEDYDEGEEV